MNLLLDELPTFVPAYLGPEHLAALDAAFDAGLAAFEEYREWKQAHREPEPLPILVFHFAAARIADNAIRNELLHWVEMLSRSRDPN